MEKEEARELIQDAITWEVVANYFTADWGEKLGVYANGKTLIGQDVCMEIAEDERPLCWITCPGIGNIYSIYWTEDWTTRDPDNGDYVTDDGRHLSLEECIWDCCENGEIADETNDIIDELLESWENNNS